MAASKKKVKSKFTGQAKSYAWRRKSAMSYADELGITYKAAYKKLFGK